MGGLTHLRDGENASSASILAPREKMFAFSIDCSERAEVLGGHFGNRRIIWHDPRPGHEMTNNQYKDTIMRYTIADDSWETLSNINLPSSSRCHAVAIDKKYT